MFNESRSLLFKRLRVVRFFDRERNVLVCVTYSERVIEGSPANSISTVPIMGWTPPSSPAGGLSLGRGRAEAGVAFLCDQRAAAQECRGQGRGHHREHPGEQLRAGGKPQA